MLDALGAVLLAAAPASTAILLASLGGLINRQGGIVNIGLEGMMLGGAFAAVLGASAGGWPAGVAAAAAAGAGLGLFLAVVVTRLDADQVIAGLGLNLAVLGFLGYLLPVRFGAPGTWIPEGLQGLPVWEVPGLAAVPGVGPLLGRQDPLTYAAWLAVPLVAWFLYRTAPGIALRASGADEEAARAAGIPTRFWREASTVAAGVFAGVAGAHLSLGVVTLFNKTMTGGRGFIALAAVYFGDARPSPTAAGALLFGFFEAASFRLGTGGWPPQLVQMLPYLVVVAGLTLVALRRRWRLRERARRAALAASGAGAGAGAGAGTAIGGAP